ncbi:hypothetical protein ACFPZ4_34355, partial [Micromonospora harpali]
MTSETMPVEQARKVLGDLVIRASLHGKTTVLTRYGQPVAQIAPYTQEQLGLGALGFGLMTTIGGIGGLIGTGLYGAITRRV